MFNSILKPNADFKYGLNTQTYIFTIHPCTGQYMLIRAAHTHTHRIEREKEIAKKNYLGDGVDGNGTPNATSPILSHGDCIGLVLVGCVYLCAERTAHGLHG